MAKKVTDGKLEVDFTYSGRRYRGFIPVATLASLLTGTLPGEEDANLGKAGPILFDRFVDDIYLPAGIWIDRKTKARLTGGAWQRAYPAPLDTLPIFLKDGFQLTQTK